MAPKKNPADPTRSGTGTSKGKAKTHQALPDPEEDANPPEPPNYAPPDLSDDDTPLLQKRRASKPEKLAKKERPRMTMLRSKPDAMPNKCQPVRRRSTVSSPFNPLRLKTWAHQPEELTRHRPAAPRRSGAKALIYKYPRKGAPHPAPPLGPRNANKAPHPRHARTTIPLCTTATGAVMKPGHPLADCIDPPWKQMRKSAT